MVLRAGLVLAFLGLVFAREIYKPYSDEELMKDRVVYTFNLLGASENDERRAKSASSEGQKLARPFPKLLLLAPADDVESSLPQESQYVNPKPIYVKKLSDPENVESQKRLIRPRRHLLLHKKLFGGGGYGGYDQGYGGGGYSGGYGGGYEGGYGGHGGHGGGLTKTVIIEVTPVHGHGGYQGGYGGYQGGHGGYQGGHGGYGGQGGYSGHEGGHVVVPVSGGCSGGCSNGGGGGGNSYSYATATATASASANSGAGSYGRK